MPQAGYPSPEDGWSSCFYGAYTATRLILSPTGTGPAFSHAGDILSLEQALGIDVELGLNKALVAVPWLARTANIFYATAHFVVTLGVFVWLYRRHPAYSRGFVDPVTALHSFGLYSGCAPR